MRIKFCLALVLFVNIISGRSQSFQVDTLLYQGDVNKYINLVILGDGYTEFEQDSFFSHANQLKNYLFSIPPWSNYAGYFNIFSIKVISAESGTSHPNTAGDCSSASPQVPVSAPNTYLGCTFDYFGIHRLMTPTNLTNLVNVLAANFPNYDQVFVLANSPYYGGAGGTFPASTIHENSPEIIAHETGHSFAFLADEYYAGDSYAMEKPNMTQETDSANVKWKNWMNSNEVGIFQHCCGGNSSLWYRPHESCKMRFLNFPYCSVCIQAIVEKIHGWVNPVVGYFPLITTINSSDSLLNFSLTQLMKPNPNTLKTVWTLDGNEISTNNDSILINPTSLITGIHVLMVTVVDTSVLLKVDNHPTVHISSVTWNINKTSTEIGIKSQMNKFSYSIFPNPANNLLTISIHSEKEVQAELKIISMEGKVIRNLGKIIFGSGENLQSYSIDELPTGNYWVSITTREGVFTQLFIKE